MAATTDPPPAGWVAQIGVSADVIFPVWLLRDLRCHRHLVVRESGTRRSASPVATSERRWTVSNMPTSIGAACRGYGFAWYPRDKIRSELKDGLLKILPMAQGRERLVTVNLIIAEPETAGPGVQRLASIIRKAAAGLAADSALEIC